MIRSFNYGSNPSFASRLEQIERTAAIEETNDGFAYFVGDPELIGSPDGILGRVISTSDTVEIELVVGEDIHPDARKTMVDICTATATDYDRYSINRAAEQKLDSLDGSKQQIAFRHLAANLLNHSSMAHGEAVHPLTRATIRSCVGWVALTRALRPEGHTAIEEFNRVGLYVPDFDSNQRLGGFMKTRKGTVPVGIARFQEKGEKHHCASCSGQILKGFNRITLSLDKSSRGSYNHHHYHENCFAETQLKKLDLKSAKIEINPHAMAVMSPQGRAQYS